MCSPRLPWEVIERVIDHSTHHPLTLQSLSLICSQLLPRTRLVKYTRVWFKDRAHVFAFIDFLCENPHLKPVVRTVVFSQASFGPSILYILPNLSSIEYVSDGIFQVPALPAHHISLVCFVPLGTHIRTLRLSKLRFPTLLAFAQLLLVMRRTTRLVCEDLEIETAGDAARLNAIRARLCNEMQLTTINIDLELLDRTTPLASPFQMRVGELLFHPTSAVQNLALRVRDDLSKDCDWSNLRSLVLRLIPVSAAPLADPRVEEVSQLLENFQKVSSLQKLTLEWQLERLLDFMRFTVSETCNTLGNALLKVSQRARLVFLISEPSANRRECWLNELEERFSALYRHEAVQLTYIQRFPSGHDSWITDLAVSPDSKWVASGSPDATIILWDASSGAMVQQWVAHSRKHVGCLAFSPDSRFLLSGCEEDDVVVWDLSLCHCARKVATLVAPRESFLFSPADVWSCAWSPDARTLAIGDSNGCMRLWDAHTFQPLALHKLAGNVETLMFSPNGRWILCVSDASDSLDQDVALYIVALPDSSLSTSPGDCSSEGECIRMLGSQTEYYPYRVTSAAFNPDSTRLSVVLYAPHAEINIVDLKTWDSTRIVSLEYLGHTKNVSFSPDGKLILATCGHTAHIWDVSTGREQCGLKGHELDITKAKFSPCGGYVGTASYDNTVRLWRTRDGVCVARLAEHTDWVCHLAFSPDGTTLSSGDYKGRVVIRRMDDILAPTLVRQDDDDDQVVAPTVDSLPGLSEDETSLPRLGDIS